MFVVAVVSAFLAASSVSAVELAKLLVLDLGGETVVVEYQAQDTDSKARLGMLPLCLWQSRVSGKLDGERESPGIAVTYVAVSKGDGDVWRKHDGVEFDIANTVPSRSGAVILTEAGPHEKARNELPPGSLRHELIADGGSKVTGLHLSPGGNRMVLNRQGSLSLATVGEAREILLAESGGGRPVIAAGISPNIAAVMYQGPRAAPSEKLVVWNSNGERTYESPEWSSDRHLSHFFDSSGRYLFWTQDHRGSRDQFSDVHVLDIANNTEMRLPIRLPKGHYYQTEDRSHLLVVSVSAESAFTADASLYSLEHGQDIHTMWVIDAETPIYDGAISENGEIAILRTRRSKGTSELLIVDRSGTATYTGEFEDSRTLGIGIVPSGLVISGVNVATDGFSKPLATGNKISVYQIQY
jgi:hypothetical protein